MAWRCRSRAREPAFRRWGLPPAANSSSPQELGAGAGCRPCSSAWTCSRQRWTSARASAHHDTAEASPMGMARVKRSTQVSGWQRCAGPRARTRPTRPCRGCEGIRARATAKIATHLLDDGLAQHAPHLLVGLVDCKSERVLSEAVHPPATGKGSGGWGGGGGARAKSRAGGGGGGGGGGGRAGATGASARSADGRKAAGVCAAKRRLRVSAAHSALLRDAWRTRARGQLASTGCTPEHTTGVAAPAVRRGDVHVVQLGQQVVRVRSARVKDVPDRLAAIVAQGGRTCRLAVRVGGRAVRAGARVRAWPCWREDEKVDKEWRPYGPGWRERPDARILGAEGAVERAQPAVGVVDALDDASERRVARALLGIETRVRSGDHGEQVCERRVRACEASSEARGARRIGRAHVHVRLVNRRQSCARDRCIRWRDRCIGRSCARPPGRAQSGRGERPRQCR